MSLDWQGAKDVLLSGERQNSLPSAILNSIVKRFEQVGGNVYVRRNKRKKSEKGVLCVRHKTSNFFVSLLLAVKG